MDSEHLAAKATIAFELVQSLFPISLSRGERDSIVARTSPSSSWSKYSNIPNNYTSFYISVQTMSIYPFLYVQNCTLGGATDLKLFFQYNKNIKKAWILANKKRWHNQRQQTIQSRKAFKQPLCCTHFLPGKRHVDLEATTAWPVYNFSPVPTIMPRSKHRESWYQDLQ